MNKLIPCHACGAKMEVLFVVGAGHLKEGTEKDRNSRGMKCPFRKITNHEMGGRGSSISGAYLLRTAEEFADCIGADCAAHHVGAGVSKCMLARRTAR